MCAILENMAGSVDREKQTSIEEFGLSNQLTIQNLALLLTTCVTSDKYLHFICKMRITFSCVLGNERCPTQGLATVDSQ